MAVSVSSDSGSGGGVDIAAGTRSYSRSRHGGGCSCRRCAGFLPANQDASTHGAYALLRLRPRASEIASGLREALGDLYQPGYEAAISGAALVAARLERAVEALTEAESPEVFSRLDADARGWARLYFGALGALGLTPSASAKLGRNLAAGQADAVRAALLSRYGETA